MSAHDDSTFMRMFLIILGALVAFTVVIMIAANTITSSADEARGDDPRLRAAITERIKPIGTVNVAGAPAATTEAVAEVVRSGADVSAVACNACHVAGVLGAPKIGDAAAWNQRLAAGGGIDGLTTSAINGKGNMPARGGAQVSDAEIRAAIEHMLVESGIAVASGDTPAPAETPAPAPVEAAVETVKEAASEAVASASGMVAAVMPEAAPAPEVISAPEVAPTPEAAPVVAAAAGPDLAVGKSVYDNACFACHATGAAGAPKLGDKSLWAPRVAKGMDALYASSLNGIGVMPPKGGRVDLSDADIKSAVAYMVEQVK